MHVRISSSEIQSRFYSIILPPFAWKKLTFRVLTQCCSCQHNWVYVCAFWKFYVVLMVSGELEVQPSFKAAVLTCNLFTDTAQRVSDIGFNQHLSGCLDIWSCSSTVLVVFMWTEIFTGYYDDGYGDIIPETSPGWGFKLWHVLMMCNLYDVSSTAC